MYYIDPDHNTLQNVLAVYCIYTLYILISVVSTRWDCGCALSCVILSVYKKRLPFLSGFICLVCIWDMQYDIRREIKRTNNADCMCTVTLEICVLLYMYWFNWQSMHGVSNISHLQIFDEVKPLKWHVCP